MPQHPQERTMNGAHPHSELHTSISPLPRATASSAPLGSNRAAWIADGTKSTKRHRCTAKRCAGGKAAAGAGAAGVVAAVSPLLVAPAGALGRRRFGVALTAARFAERGLLLVRVGLGVLAPFLALVRGMTTTFRTHSCDGGAANGAERNCGPADASTSYPPLLRPHCGTSISHPPRQYRNYHRDYFWNIMLSWLSVLSSTHALTMGGAPGLFVSIGVCVAVLQTRRMRRARAGGSAARTCHR